MPNKPNFPTDSIFNDVYADLQARDLLSVNPDDLAPDTPDDVIITGESRVPVFDSTLGITVGLPEQDPPKNRIVAIGDSLTHGFQSGAIFNTDISYPAIIAYELGWYPNFRHPRYDGYGGLPINIEFLLRTLEQKYGSEIDWWELALAGFTVRHFMAEVEDWWERGPGSRVPEFQDLNHNLAVFGWDVRDALDRTAKNCHDFIGTPKNQLFQQIVEHANERAALRVLNYSELDPDRNELTALAQAKALGEQGAVNGGAGDGIETLIVLLGANNALGSVLNLNVKWSGPGYDVVSEKWKYNVWRPLHFESEYNKLVAEVKKIKARHVIFGTVPHVTIAPIARGVGRKVRPGSRYYPFYTRPWIQDADFDDKHDPHITEQQARAIDSAVDQYNYCITEEVRVARRSGADWHVLDVAGILDRLASRRYIDDPSARPAWWSPYELPPELTNLNPKPDSRFFVGDRNGARVQGGIFALDGVHPTTIGYGLVAQEFINIMQTAGVKFKKGDGVTDRVGPVRVDFNRLIQLDTLISDPPKSIGTDLHLIGWFDEKIDFFKRMLRAGS
jgi:hypothetical protein